MGLYVAPLYIATSSGVQTTLKGRSDVRSRNSLIIMNNLKMLYLQVCIRKKMLIARMLYSNVAMYVHYFTDECTVQPTFKHIIMGDCVSGKQA